MSESLFSLNKISYSRSGKSTLFDQLNFEVSSGDSIGLIGGNGAGKTSLLHLMIGLLKPSSGEIFAFGKQRVLEDDFYDVRCKTGLLFQNSDDQLFCPTVEEDVSFGPLNLGKSHADACAITSQTLNRLGLEGFEKRITHHLSGGEKRLVALACVLAMEPEIILMDEPTTGLDALGLERLSTILLELNIAKVIVSHDLKFLDEMTDKTYSLEAGVLTQR